MKEKARYYVFHWLDRYVGIFVCALLVPLRSFMRARGNACKNILVIKIGTLGDAILLQPALRALRERFCGSRISVLCSQANLEIFQSYAFVDRMITVHFNSLLNPLYIVRLVGLVRKSRFDLVVDFEEWSRFSALIAFFSRAPRSIGFRTQGQLRHTLFTEAIAHDRHAHELDCFLRLLKPLNIEIRSKDISLHPAAENMRDAHTILQKAGITGDFIVLNSEVPFSAIQRQWPLEYFAKLGDELIKHHNVALVIISSKKGEPEAKHLNRLLDNRGKIIAGVALLTLVSILQKAKCVVVNNTGFMHLAASSGTTVFALHGPTSSEKWGPWGNNNLLIRSKLSCSPCLYLGYEYACTTNQCMKEIVPEEVFKQIESFLLGPHSIYHA